MNRRYTRRSGEVRTYAYSDFRPSALMACRAALRLGVLKCCGTVWLYDRRFFSARTVNSLIASGEAVRIGNEIRSANVC